MENPVIIGAVVWTATALVCFVCFRKVAYNLLDPLIVSIPGFAFSASLLSVLCATNLVAWSKFVLFSLVLLGYLVGARTVSSGFEREYFRNTLRSIIGAVRRNEANVLLLSAVLITAVLAILALLMGAQGDARQGFAKLFRPLVVIQSGLYLLALILLLSPRFSTLRALVWLSMLTLFSMPFSGKSIFLPVLFWFGLRLFVIGKRVSIRAVVTSAFVALFGAGVMLFLSYGKADVIARIAVRLWLSGDVYIYAYQSDALAAIHRTGHYDDVTFLSYMLHPITSLVGIRGYDKPLGAMLASEVAGDDVLTGPNPQLPVVLDYFFPDALLACAVIAFIIGFLVMGIRPLVQRLARCRSRYLRVGVVAAAVFCPPAGFSDTSQVLITGIGIAAVSIGAAMLEMLFASGGGIAGTAVDQPAPDSP